MLYISVPLVTYEPLPHKGALQSVSLEEIRAAFLLAFARDIAAGAPESVVREWMKFSWRRLCYMRLPPQKYFRACQLRENLAAVNDAMTRTTLQKIYEVVHFRDQHVRAHGINTGTAAAIAAPTRWSRQPKDVNLSVRPSSTPP